MDDPPDVRATYDRIAEHFARTRRHPWPEVESFLDGRRGERALDVGCGNGRHLDPLAACARQVVGVDLSRGLLAEARDGADREVALLQGDAADLPLAAEGFDLALYVAAVHHLRPRARRLRSLDELARVLAPGGRALVSAWSTTHDRFDREAGFDTAVDWTLPGGETVPRYYHIYDPAEFRADIDDSALRAVETFLASGNSYAVVAP